MKKHSVGKKILISVICVAAVAALGIGAWFLIQRSQKEPVKVFSFQFLGMTEYWGDSMESYGFVRADGVQAVYLSETQTVTSVLVQEGDTVKKGDVLLTYDTTLSDLELERKRLGVEKLKLQLNDAEERLEEIKDMKPMVVVKPSEDEEDEEDLGEWLTEPYRISTDPAYDGSSEDKALICWMRNTGLVGEELLAELSQKAQEYQAQNLVTPDPTEEPTPDPTDPTEEPTAVPETPNRFFAVIKSTEDDREYGMRTVWQGLCVAVDEAGTVQGFRFFDAYAVPDHMLAPEPEEEPEPDYGSGFTAKQIAEMRAEQEKTIRDLQFEIRMAEAEYAIAESELDDGNLYAELDGVVVSLMSAEDAEMLGVPMLKVSAGGGFYVEGTLSEMDLDSVPVGTQVTVMDWNTGASYLGTVEQIGEYPSSGNYWNGMGNPNASHYPFRVYLSGDADLQPDSYVGIQFSESAGESGIYLENPYLRTEAGRSYVYVRGADGMLEKRYVVTGKSLWGSYTEILSGITAEDFLAFPYGKHVRDGAETLESDISALYE